MVVLNMFFSILVFVLTLFWVISFLQDMELRQNNVMFLKKEKKSGVSFFIKMNWFYFLFDIIGKRVVIWHLICLIPFILFIILF